MQVETDIVIFALGESPDLTVLPRGIETDKTHIIVDPETFAANLPGIFSAGAAVSGHGIVLKRSHPAKRRLFPSKRGGGVDEQKVKGRHT